MAFYLHLGPFARQVIAAIDARLAELDLAATQGCAAVGEAALAHGRALPGMSDLLTLNASGFE
jgi:hypothetical protein